MAIVENYRGHLLKSWWNIVIDEIFGSLGVMFVEKFLGGKSAHELIHTFFVKFWVFEPVLHKKIIQYVNSLSLAELIVLWPFNIQNCFICTSIRNWIASANETSIVN